MARYISGVLLELPGFPALQVGQDFHVAVEARRTASEVLADMGVRRFGRMFGHIPQLGIGRTVDPLRIRKRFRKIRFGEAEEFFLSNFLLLFVVRHRLTLPTSVRRAPVA